MSNRGLDVGRAWNAEPCAANPNEIESLLEKVQRDNLDHEKNLDDQVGYIRVDEATAVELFKSQWTSNGLELVETAIQTAKETYGELDFDLTGEDWHLPDIDIGVGFDKDSLAVMVAPTSDRQQRERLNKNYQTAPHLFHFQWDEIDTPYQTHYDHSLYPSEFLSLDADPEPDFGV